MVALSANLERWRVDRWLSDQAISGATGTRLHFHGKCERPVEIFARGLPDKLAMNLGFDTDRHQVATLMVPCRQCDACLRYRSGLWSGRAEKEIAASNRTWFGTLTLSPDNAIRHRYASELRLSQRGHTLEETASTELFKAFADSVSSELTKWLKRVRKNSGARLRYLLVCEAHKSGVPHWHVLLHEQEGRVTKVRLEAAWRLGFSHWRLVETGNVRAARYVCKYLSKSAQARVRASGRYGAVGAARLAEQLEGCLTSITPKGEATQMHCASAELQNWVTKLTQCSKLANQEQ